MDDEKQKAEILFIFIYFILNFVKFHANLQAGYFPACKFKVTVLWM